MVRAAQTSVRQPGQMAAGRANSAHYLRVGCCGSMGVSFAVALAEVDDSDCIADPQSDFLLLIKIII